MYKIVHIMTKNIAFIPPFIKFVNQNLGAENHKYIILADKDNDYEKLLGAQNVEFINIISQRQNVFRLLKYLYNSKKIIIHGLWVENFVKVLFLHPDLLRKSYWIMWGGDFYFPEKHSYVKKEVIKKIEYLVTGTRGDYELVKKWYSAKGKYIKCFNYPSSLYKEYDINEKSSDTINIQVGNSAATTNNHLEIFDKLLKYKEENIKIFVPLSYGNKEYKKEVMFKGREMFGDKFVAITEFLSFDKYLDFLANIDIAVFNHKRQQAFGNIITLLGFGKKVYIHPSSTLNGVFREYNIKVYNVNDISIKMIDENVRKQNIENVKQNFSKEALIESLKQYLLV